MSYILDIDIWFNWAEGSRLCAEHLTQTLLMLCLLIAQIERLESFILWAERIPATCFGGSGTLWDPIHLHLCCNLVIDDFLHCDIESTFALLWEQRLLFVCLAHLWVLISLLLLHLQGLGHRIFGRWKIRSHILLRGRLVKARLDERQRLRRILVKTLNHAGS